MDSHGGQDRRPDRFQLGEGTHWREDRLYFVDLLQSALYGSAPVAPRRSRDPRPGWRGRSAPSPRCTGAAEWVATAPVPGRPTGRRGTTSHAFSAHPRTPVLRNGTVSRSAARVRLCGRRRGGCR